MRLIVLMLTLAIFGGGCAATTSSRNIRTAGVVALIDATSERAGEVVVETDLVIGGASSNTYVVLDGSDRLLAEAGGEKREMDAIDDGEYEAKFAMSEGDVAVALEREHDAPAPESRGTLPAPFEITSEFGATPISRNDSVTVTWSPGESDAEVELVIEGDCIHSETFRVGGDPGQYELAKGSVQAWKSKAKDACNVTVQVTRTRLGTVDPAFDSDSRFRLRQVRTTRFVSGP